MYLLDPPHRPWASNPNSELWIKPYRHTPIVSFSQTFTHCCTYLQLSQSQQQQMNVHFQRFSGCYAALWGKTRPVTSRGGTGSGLPESTPAGFCVFLLDPNPDPESKICEKPDPEPESLFHFGSSRSLCGHLLGKNMDKLQLDGWL